MLLGYGLGPSQWSGSVSSYCRGVRMCQEGQYLRRAHGLATSLSFIASCRPFLSRCNIGP